MNEPRNLITAPVGPSAPAPASIGSEPSQAAMAPSAPPPPLPSGYVGTSVSISINARLPDGKVCLSRLLSVHVACSTVLFWLVIRCICSLTL